MKALNTKSEGAEGAGSRPARVSVVEDDNVVREQLVHLLNRAHGFSSCIKWDRGSEAETYAKGHTKMSSHL
jgi:hypothetical protein